MAILRTVSGECDMDIITANSNPRVKELVKLNKDVRFRRQRNVFVVEGIRMFRELPADRVQAVYLSETAYGEYGDELAGLGLMDGEVHVMTDSVFECVSQTKTPQGCMAVVGCFHHRLEDVLGKTENEVYLVLDKLQDPGNMGTILRSAEAAGVTAVIIGGGSCDPYNPKTIRSTMGAVFRVPFVVCGSSADTIEAIEVLRRSGVVVYGAHLDGDSLYDIHLPKKTAFLIGNEGNGLSPEVAETADRLLRIPMEGDVESLNAAVSAGILSYEALRQRKYNRQN